MDKTKEAMTNESKLDHPKSFNKLKSSLDSVQDQVQEPEKIKSAENKEEDDYANLSMEKDDEIDSNNNDTSNDEIEEKIVKKGSFGGENSSNALTGLGIGLITSFYVILMVFYNRYRF